MKTGFETIMIKNVGKDLPDFNGDEIFWAIHLALENVRNESLEGVDETTVFNAVADLANISEMLFDLKNSIRKAKGKSELDIEQARDEVSSVHMLTFHHPRCDCGKIHTNSKANDFSNSKKEKDNA